MTSVHQFVPTLAPRDAVGGHYLAVRDALRDAGYSSEIYAFEAKDAYKKLALPFRSFEGGRPGEATWLVYHSSIGSPVADFVLGRREPVIVDYHNITPSSFFARWEPYVAGQLAVGRRQLAKLAVRAELGLADSAYNARELHELDYERVAVVPILFDTSSLGATEPDPALLDRLRAAKNRGGADWLFVGRISPNKAQHDLVKAFAAYREHRDPQARLHLVGGTSSHAYVTALEKFVTALELDDAVEITGAVSEEAKHAYYEAADLFVICSEHEGFCVPLLEAMHHRVPIVAYAAAAVPETLGTGGLCLPVKDPLTVAAAAARVIGDAGLRAALTAAGTARLADFDLASSRERLVAAVRGVVGPA
ncbi:MAG: glycosyltransferase family 4 protein [Actinomycetota bacterium]|nr:glycosyltransferase family 4 protein [Actinomycetota bacterium]